MSDQKRTPWACAVRRMKRLAKHYGVPLKAHARSMAAVHGPQRNGNHHVAEFWLGNKPGKAGGVPL